MQSRSSREVTISGAATAMVSMICSITLAECLFYVLYTGVLLNWSKPGFYLLYGTPFLIALIAAPAFAFIVKEGRGAFVLGLASVTLATIVVVNFRGSHRWHGFYDLPGFSRMPYVIALLAACGLGLGLSRVLSRYALLRIAWSIIAVAVLWAWIDAYRGLRIITFVPYTRHIALATLAVVALAVVVYAKANGEEVDEASIYAN